MYGKHYKLSETPRVRVLLVISYFFELCQPSRTLTIYYIIITVPGYVSDTLHSNSKRS